MWRDIFQQRRGQNTEQRAGVGAALLQSRHQLPPATRQRQRVQRVDGCLQYSLGDTVAGQLLRYQ